MSEIKNANKFIQRLKVKTDIYSNFNSIVEKADQEGYLHCAHLTLNNIFQQEIKYAVEGSLIRNFKNSNFESGLMYERVG